MDTAVKPVNLKREIFSVLLVSVVAMALLIYIIYFLPPLIPDIGNWIYSLSYLNGILNFLAFICLTIGLIRIKQENKKSHENWMKLAFIFSFFFLISYLVHHAFLGDQKFLGTGFLRISYFIILITHIFCSIINFPMVLTTFWFAHRKYWPQHKKLARWTYPLWQYVSITGVLIVIYLKFLNPV